MARLPRYDVPDLPQHVIQRGNNRAPMFRSPADYRVFREYLGSACTHHGCALHACVLMTNHVHLLATPSTAGAIGKAMQSVGRRYVAYFNAAYQRTGTLWEGRFRATVIDSEHYLFTCFRYIELNPVRAGMVREPWSYPWSSHLANAFGVSDALLSPHTQYTALGEGEAERLSAYRALFADPLDDVTLDTIRESTNRAWALGADDFCEQVAAMSGRRSIRQQRGRNTPDPICGRRSKGV
jgi:putative transposase